MKRIYPDRNYCMGCGLCELACLAAHSAKNDLVHAYREERPAGLDSHIRVYDDGQSCVAVNCRHCENPHCVAVCISGALVRDALTGVVTYEAQKCVACWSCLVACPYAAIKRHRLEDKIIKCDLCKERSEGPACVQACPNLALVFEDRQ